MTNSLAQKKILLWSAVLVFGATGCSVQLTWTLPVVVTDHRGPLPGVEVAVEGRFVGVTDAQGRLDAQFDAKPLQTARVEFRVSSFEAAHAPKSVFLELPSLWRWAVGANLKGASTLPSQEVALGVWNPKVFAEASEDVEASESSEAAELVGAADGLGGSLRGTEGMAEADLPEAVAEQGAERSNALQGLGRTAARQVPADPTEAGEEPRSETGNETKKEAQKDPKEVRKAERTAQQNGETAAEENGEVAQAVPIPGEAQGVASGGTGVPSEDPTQAMKQEGTDLAGEKNAVPGKEHLTTASASLVLESFLEGKPLAATQVYSIRQASGRIVKLGETDAAGRLEARHPAALLGESLFVRNPCCVSVLRPLTMGQGSKGPRSLRVDLSPGVSHDFVAVQTSYGHPRAVEKVTLQHQGRTLDVTGPAGVAVVSAKNIAVGLAALEVGSSETLPTRKALALEIGATTAFSPHLLEVARGRPRLPQVGFLELAGGNVVHAETNLRGEPSYRRARRDFLSRFVQEKSLRPLIFQEVKKIADAAGAPVESWVRRGWDTSAAAGEVDFLVALESKGDGAARARLFDSEGTVLWDETFPYGGSAKEDESVPELAGKAAFDGLLKALPFEFVVKGVQDSAEKTARVELEVGEDALARGLVSKDDVFKRVGKGDACEGVLSEEKATLVVQGACAEEAGGIVVGDTFQRQRKKPLVSGIKKP